MKLTVFTHWVRQTWPGKKLSWKATWQSLRVSAATASCHPHSVSAQITSLGTLWLSGYHFIFKWEYTNLTDFLLYKSVGIKRCGSFRTIWRNGIHRTLSTVCLNPFCVLGGRKALSADELYLFRVQYIPYLLIVSQWELGICSSFFI